MNGSFKLRASKRRLVSLSGWMPFALGAVAFFPDTALADQYFTWTGQASSLPHPHIAVVGVGTVPVTPDRAIVYFALATTGTNPSAAAAETGDMRRQLVDVLSPLGVRASDVASWGYGVGSRSAAGGMRRNPDVLAALEEYGARLGVRVVVDSLERLDAIVSAGVSVGDVSVPVVTFEARDTAEAREEAIALAFSTAQRDATALAQAAGGELGDLLSMTSAATPEFGTQFSVLYQGGGGLQIPLQPSDVTVRMTVSVAWRFRP